VKTDTVTGLSLRSAAGGHADEGAEIIGQRAGKLRVDEDEFRTERSAGGGHTSGIGGNRVPLRITLPPWLAVGA
jgi:hypothetical protein